jgi:hypothetical protein
VNPGWPCWPQGQLFEVAVPGGAGVCNSHFVIGAIGHYHAMAADDDKVAQCVEYYRGRLDARPRTPESLQQATRSDCSRSSSVQGPSAAPNSLSPALLTIPSPRGPPPSWTPSSRPPRRRLIPQGIGIVRELGLVFLELMQRVCR